MQLNDRIPWKADVRVSCVERLLLTAVSIDRFWSFGECDPRPGPIDSRVFMKLLKSICLILGAMGALVVAGLLAFYVIWITVTGLFLISRLSEITGFFTEWSWPQFLVTIGFGLGIPYIYLLLSAGF